MASKNIDFDVMVIGAGVLGCFAARELTRFGLRVCVLEKNADVCAGISKANTAIIYSGYDTKPGTLKTELTVKANRDMACLCEELNVPFARRGSLLVASGPKAEAVVRQKYLNGITNGLTGLELIGGDEARRREKNLSADVTLALYSPSSGTLDPWEFGIAAAENAAANGAEFRFRTKVIGLAFDASKECYRVTTETGEWIASAVVNAAGLFGDEVLAACKKPAFCIVPTKAEYILYDTYAAAYVKHILFHEREDGKGISIVPTVSGNVLVGPMDFDAAGQKDDLTTTASEQRYICNELHTVLKEMPDEYKIRSFAGERPNVFFTSAEGWPHPDKSRSINELMIVQDDDSPCLITFAGIKTPGLTCAREIGAYAASIVTAKLRKTELSESFDPSRRTALHFGFRNRSGMTMAGSETTVVSKSGMTTTKSAMTKNIVCRCRGISEAAVREAVYSMSGAATINGIKRRTGAGLGRCQGSFCLQNIIEIIADERNVPAEDILLEEAGSNILVTATSTATKKRLQRQFERSKLREFAAANKTIGGIEREVHADIAIIGSGPAGLSAAKSARENGAERVVIIDRLPEPGGLLPQCIHHGFGMRKYGKELTGPEYASRLIAEAEEAGAEMFSGTSVISITPKPTDKNAVAHRSIELENMSQHTAAEKVFADMLVFAAGCRERPIGHLPVTGNRPAGIFTAGSAQRLMNIGGYSIGKKAVILGSGDVGLIMARQMKLAGMEVVCAIEQADVCGGLPKNKRECLDAFGIPLITGHTVSRIFGTGRVEGVAVSASGKHENDNIIECDTLITAVGLIPERDLLHGMSADDRIILCGNASSIKSFADDIADDGERAGRLAAVRKKNNLKAKYG